MKGIIHIFRHTSMAALVALACCISNYAYAQQHTPLSAVADSTLRPLAQDSLILPIDSAKTGATVSQLLPQKQLQQLSNDTVTSTTLTDSIPQLLKNIPPIDSSEVVKNLRPAFIPDSKKATWLAVICPGGGQIYNRKYWKLPIIYGGFFGCAYALGWNSKMYADYSQAFLDIMDDNPATKSYEDLLPPNYNYPEEQLKQTLKRRKDFFRRYRDISIFAFIAVYALSVIDAYVDAELSNFDIGPDISMRVTAIPNSPTPIRTNSQQTSVGMQCVWHF